MSNCDFIALDVETANENYWSICQVGLAYFKDRVLIDSWSTYVNPQTYFSSINISIHGITEDKVKHSIKLPEMYDLVNQKVSGQIVAHHMPFDRVAFCRCAVHTNKNVIDCQWVDTARVARRTWREVSQKGYGLLNLTRSLNIIHDHPHDASDDARSAGMILLKAHESSGTQFSDWVKAYQTKVLNIDGSISHGPGFLTSDKDLRNLANSEPDPDGVLFGEVVVFTGELSISRLDAAQLAYKMGCNIDTGVTRNTTILVVGDQDILRLAGYSKSSKHRKAEKLISKGQQIRIMGEADFRAILSCS